MAAPGQRHQRGHVIKRADRWVVRYRVDVAQAGTQRVLRRRATLTLGTVQELRTHSAARAVADQVLDAITGRHIAPGRAISAARYLTRYQAERVVLMRPSSQENVRRMIRGHLAPLLAGLRLDQVNAGTAQQLVSRFASAGRAPSSARQVVKLLRTILRTAQGEGYAAHPFELRAIRFASQVKARARRALFQPTEIATLLEHAPFPWRAAYALGALLGLRCGETLGLEWPDVDLEGGTVTLRQAAVRGRLQALKTSRSAATLPLSQALAAILRAYHAHRGAPTAGLLFVTRTGRPLHASSYRRALARHLQQLGIAHRGTHAFRHSAASHLLAQGLSAATVRDSLRHHDVKQTDTYSHSVSDDLRRGADLLGSLITTPRAPR